MKKYDIIGDIHGYGGPLKELLVRLGYEERDGCYRHTGRTAIFLGDFIDRGPEIPEVLRLIRAMVENGAALAVMGNHEYNAICFHTQDKHGGHLRSHTEDNGKNVRQHQATLTQFVERPEEWAGYLAWFRTLPLYLDLSGLRIVHACWDAEQISQLGSMRLTDELLFKAAEPASPEGKAIDILLKGKELSLPEESTFTDKEGIVRKQIRVKWWLGAEKQTYRSLSLPDSEDAPRISVPVHHHAEIGNAYPQSDPPVFVGHYWLPPKRPEALASNVACVDYSIAQAGGLLVAYSWDGEDKIDREKFTWVSRENPGFLVGMEASLSGSAPLFRTQETG
ncbi:MAG: hypothetical protein JWL59_3440 [Chthoniobacteraceae bacterium]|nr:hypothetical protein [Chthoniobacteraceae bacterium]